MATNYAGLSPQDSDTLDQLNAQGQPFDATVGPDGKLQVNKREPAFSLDQFNWNAARQDGFSDREILDGLFSSGVLGFDLKAARADGYSDEDIVNFYAKQPEPVKAPEQSGWRRAADVGISAVKSAIAVPEAVVGLADIPTMGYAGKAAEAIGFRPKEAKAALDDLLSDKQKAANKAVEDAKGFFPTIGAALQNPSVIGHSVIESAGLMGAGGVVGRGLSALVSPVTAAAMGEGVVGAGAAAEQIRQETKDGLLTPFQGAAAIGSGIGTSVFGAIGGKLSQKLGITDVDTYLATGKIGETNKGIIRRIVEGGISEGVFEELPQSVQEQMWQNAALNRPIMQGVPEGAAMGLLAGAAMGGGFGILSGPQRATPEADPTKLADQEAQVTDPIKSAGPILAAPDVDTAIAEAFKSAGIRDLQDQAIALDGGDNASELVSGNTPAAQGTTAIQAAGNSVPQTPDAVQNAAENLPAVDAAARTDVANAAPDVAQKAGNDDISAGRGAAGDILTAANSGVSSADGQQVDPGTGQAVSIPASENGPLAPAASAAPPSADALDAPIPGERLSATPTGQVNENAKRAAQAPEPSASQRNEIPDLQQGERGTGGNKSIASPDVQGGTAQTSRGTGVQKVGDPAQKVGSTVPTSVPGLDRRATARNFDPDVADALNKARELGRALKPDSPQSEVDAAHRAAMAAEDLRESREQERKAPKFVDYAEKKGKAKGEIKFFSNASAALKYKGNKKIRGYVPRETSDGWVLSKPFKPRSEKQLANDAKKKAKTEPIDILRDELQVALRKMGGIDIDEALASGFDKADIARANIPGFGNRKLFRKGGMSLDAAREAIAQGSEQAGYLDPNQADDLNHFIDRLMDSVKDQASYYSFAGQEYQLAMSEAAKEADRGRSGVQLDREDQAEAGIDSLPKQEQNEVQAAWASIDRSMLERIYPSDVIEELSAAEAQRRKEQEDEITAFAEREAISENGEGSPADRTRSAQDDRGDEPRSAGRGDEGNTDEAGQGTRGQVAAEPAPQAPAQSGVLIPGMSDGKMAQLRSASEPALDIDRKPNGWLLFRGNDEVALVHPDKNEVRRFDYPANSGTGRQRAIAYASAFAQDNPVAAKELPKGELEIQPIFRSKGNANSLNTSPERVKETAESAQVETPAETPAQPDPVVDPVTDPLIAAADRMTAAAERMASAAESFLQNQTPADLRAQAEAEVKAKAEADEKERKAAEAESKAQERETVRQRSEGAAADFQLGQSAMDNLTGQKSMFDRKAADASGPPMVALHNLSADNLIYADDAGGLAVPSIAITRPDENFNGFGEITLIGDRKLANPGGTNRVFNADAYTARHPELLYDKVAVKKAQPLVDRFRQASKDADNRGLIDTIWDNQVNSPDPQRMRNDMQRSRGAMLQYAREHGIDITIPMRTKPARFEWARQPAMMQAVKEMQAEGVKWNDIRPGDPEWTRLSNAAREAIGQYWTENEDLPKDMAERMRQTTIDDVLDEKTGDLHFSYGSRAFSDVLSAEETEVDTMALEKALKANIPQLAFNKWVDRLVADQFDLPHIKLNGRKVLATLDNIVEAMTSGRGVKGKEKSMTFGMGATKAAMSKEFPDFAAMDKSRQLLLRSKDLESIKKETQKLVDEFQQSAVGYWPYKTDSWGALDASMKVLARATKTGKATEEKIRAAMRAEGFEGNFTNLEEGAAAANALRNAAVPYFESKPQRAVKLKEFAGAVVPAEPKPGSYDYEVSLEANRKAKAALERNGIPYREYDGDNRAQVLQDFAAELNQQQGDVLFSRNQKQAQSIQASDARAATEVITKKWKNAPKITVHESLTSDSVPAGLRSAMEKEGVTDARGAWHAGEIHLFPSNIGSLAELERTIVHEARHYGLEGLFGKDMNPILMEIYMKDKGVRTEANRLVKTLKVSTVDAVNETLANMPLDAAKKLPAWKKLVAKLKAWLNDRGFTNLAKMLEGPSADAITKDILYQVEQFVKTGKRGDTTFTTTLFHRAFHGSPHDHDGFSLDKIGTGEGAQAYGWGLYFAGKQKVAEYYKNTLSKNIRAHNTFDGKRISAGMVRDLKAQYAEGTPIGAALRDLGALKLDGSSNAKDMLLKFADAQQGYADQSRQRAAELSEPEIVASTYTEDDMLRRADYYQRKADGYRELASRLGYVEQAKSGKLYEVELAPKQEDYLDWDKPLSQQSEKVRGILEQNFPEFYEMQRAYEAKNPNNVFGEGTGKEFYKWLAARNDVRDYNSISIDPNGERKASELLKSIGIPGIRFLDGASRNRPLKDIKREFLAELPEDANFDDVSELIGTGKFSPKNDALLKALADDDWLGFDYPSQAVSAALGSGINNMDPSPALLKAIAAAQEGGTHNFVIFDDKDVSIVAKYSRTAADAPKKWDAPEPSKMDSILYKLADKQIDLKRVTEAVRDGIGEILETWDAYLKETLFHGRSAKRVATFAQKELKPLLNDMQLRGVTIPELETYLHNRHAEERNKQVAKINPKLPDRGSGITTKDARAYLAGLTTEQRTKYEALAKKVDAITKGTRQTLQDYGLMSTAEMAQWEGAYKHYVPLMKDTEVTGQGEGFSIRGDESKRALGDGAIDSNILANLMAQRERAIVRGEKNRVALSLYGLAKLNPNEDFWSVDNPPIIRRVVKLSDKFDRRTIPLGMDIPENATEVVVEGPDPMFLSRENVIVTKYYNPATDTVTEKAIVFNEDNPRAVRMAAALKNLDADQMGEIMNTMAKATRFLASVNTQYNPIFGLVNLARDVQGAMLNLTSTELAGKQKQVLLNARKALAAVYMTERNARKGREPKGEWGKLYDEFQNVGAQTGYRDLFTSSQDRADALQREINKITEGKVKQAGRAIFDWLSDYNQAMENSVRLAAYKVGLDQGLSKEAAANVAKNLTVNFNRKGQITQQAGALYAFFNASVQGTARLAQTLKGPAGKRILIGGLILGALQAMMLAGFDEDEPPQFERERNLIIPIGGKDYFKIPMPLGLHVIPNISRILIEMGIHGKPMERLFQLMSVTVDAFNPVGAVGLSAQTFTPTVADPFVALGENRDWTGKPIAREDFSSLNPTPGHSRAKDTASIISKTLSEGLNWLSGGTEYTKGKLSPTPDQLDYLFGQVGGGVWREGSKFQQSISSGFTGEELPPYKIPVIGRFYGSTGSQASKSALFYRNLKQLNAHEAEIEGRQKAGQDPSDYIRDNPDSELYQAANRIEREISKRMKQKRQMVKDNAPKSDVKDLENEMAELMHEFNQEVAARRGK